MSDAELERRFATYADAIVAFATVNMLAFASTLADPEIRCTLARISHPVVLANVLVGAANLVGLAVCERVRRRLAGSARPASRVARIYERRLARFCVALVCASALAAVVATAFDPACGAP